MVDIDLPLFHLGSTLFGFGEHLEERFAFLDPTLSIGVRSMAHLLHKLEVGAHRVRKARHLAQLGN